MSDATYPETKSNLPSRHPERARYDAATVHSVLDEGWVAHVGFVADGLPQVLPMLYVRIGETLYLHGSTGAHLNRSAARGGGLPIVVEVTLFDELVLARATFNHSVNYRSVVVRGEATIVPDGNRKAEVLETLVEKLVPGRSADARPPAADELRKTAVLELTLADVVAKVRTGDPTDEAPDLERACWAGVQPLRTVFGEPRASGDLAGGLEVPEYLAGRIGAPASSLS